MKHIALIGLLFACGSKSSSDEPRAAAGCAKDTDCKGDRVCQAGACVAAGAAAPAPSGGAAAPAAPAAPAPVATAPAAPAPVAPPAGAPAVTCEVAVSHAYEVVGASGNAALTKLAAQHPASETIGACQQEAWSDDIRQCLVNAKSIDDVYHDCYMRPLAGKDLAIGRTFDIANADANKRATPAMFSQSGDYFQIERNCGFLYQEVVPAHAFFILCDGKTTGPLSMPDEVQAAFAAFSSNEANRHHMVSNLISKTKVNYFGGNHRVCDAMGNCHVE